MSLPRQSDSVMGRPDVSERPGTPAGNGGRNNYCATKPFLSPRESLRALEAACRNGDLHHGLADCMFCGAAVNPVRKVSKGQKADWGGAFGTHEPHCPFAALVEASRDLPDVAPEGATIHVHYKGEYWRGFACSNTIGSVEFEHVNAAACTRGLLERLLEEGGR